MLRLDGVTRGGGSASDRRDGLTRLDGRCDAGDPVADADEEARRELAVVHELAECRHADDGLVEGVVLVLGCHLRAAAADHLAQGGGVGCGVGHGGAPL